MTIPSIKVIFKIIIITGDVTLSVADAAGFIGAKAGKRALRCISKIIWNTKI